MKTVMTVFIVLSTFLCLARARPTMPTYMGHSDIELQRMKKDMETENLVSVCPTLLEIEKKQYAIHYLTKDKVDLVGAGNQAQKFSVGSCLYSTPINDVEGTCEITSQRHRAWIQTSKGNAGRYQQCRPSDNVELVWCLEWIELPGLCQLKIPRV
ncbi:uncharacterized protein LOC143447497 [Clavelina lepadiformis]|uniref:uncharacterized protein LOC143447497 n=1 Tax=Clavelina lepadiformis TaxID=159417 RepID=UPI0040429E89